jgi:hypothetical protein
MNEKRRPFAHYNIIRGNQTLWKGDPSVSGARCCQVVVKSDEFISVHGTFQVYCVEGTSKGIVDGKLSVPEPFSVLFDQDFQGLQAATNKFRELIEGLERQGFRKYSMSDEFAFQAKLNS